MGTIRYFKGTQSSFEKIKSMKKFYKVTDIYLDEDGGIYYCVEEAPLNDTKISKIETEFDNNKKILYNINIKENYIKSEE